MTRRRPAVVRAAELQRGDVIELRERESLEPQTHEIVLVATCGKAVVAALSDGTEIGFDGRQLLPVWRF